jgi:hypothetical protein
MKPLKGIKNETVRAPASCCRWLIGRHPHGDGTMTSDDLTKSQAQVISKALFPGVNYLVRLKTQMEKVDFPGDDKLYQGLRSVIRT